MNDSKSKIRALEKAIHGLKPYVQHAQHCQYYSLAADSLNNCTCDLDKAVKAVQKALKIKV